MVVRLLILEPVVLRMRRRREQWALEVVQDQCFCCPKGRPLARTSLLGVQLVADDLVTLIPGADVGIPSITIALIIAASVVVTDVLGPCVAIANVSASVM